MIVLDTHALIWWVTDSPKLSATAHKVIESEAARRPVVTSAISIFEIVTAVRRGRLEFDIPLRDWLELLESLATLRVEPVSANIARQAAMFDDPMPGDPADRIIAATALALQARLVTADGKLNRVARLDTVW